MDIFRWIKREWDTTQSCRRRDSEPIAPASGYHFNYSNNNNLSRSRDEAYLRALRKFNEWRHKERSGSFRRLSRRLSKKSIIKTYSEHKAVAETTAAAQQETTITVAAQSVVMMKEAKTPEESNHDESHLYEELKTPRRPKPKNLFDSAKKLLQKSQSFPTNVSNCNNNTVEAENTVNVLKSYQKCPVINETDENEVEVFENDHCTSIRQIDLANVQKQSSPPNTFFRNNSNPFSEVRSPVRMNRYHLASFNKPKRLFACTNDSIDKLIRESLPKDRDQIIEEQPGKTHGPSSIPKRYDFSSSAIYENDARQNSASQTPMYQTVINKHGDLVEYAVPFNDQNDEEFCEFDESSGQRPKLHPTTNNLNASTFPLFEVNGASNEKRASQSLCDLNTYAELRKVRKNVIVTDLDKSDDHSKNRTPDAEIFEELESLKNWSKRLRDPVEFQPFVTEEIKGNNLIICSADNISQRISTLKNTMSGPISLSSGNFRKTTVSLRKVEKRVRIQSEQGLLQDLCILNKIKHPNVALLMAVCLDVNNKILSLVLEPFSTNINSLIYDSDCKIIMKDCIEYILQVIKAVIYLHENGIIHSNICSHNVLVCENKKVVKLSAFELATDVNVYRIQNEIVRMFYGNFDNFQKSILKSSIAEEGWNAMLSKTKIPSQHLPYLIEYRKLYSEHYYQPPELISSFKHFVFPTKQADVYNIALLLWEMLNSCVPFAIFSYEEVENLFQLNDNNQLPLFDDRCELFETLLQNGLITFPNSRIDNVQSMKFLVEEAKVHLKLSETASKSSMSGGSTNKELMNGKNEVNMEHENLCTPDLHTLLKRTSTSKKDVPVISKIPTAAATDCKSIEQGNQNNIKSQSNTSKYNSRSLDDILRDHGSYGKTKKGYEFQIEEFSLPSTPIARKNKLRRNAWLSNKMLFQKSFDESEEDALEQLNNENLDKCNVKNKLINVNIKIIQNKIDKSEEIASPKNAEESQENTANVSSQIDYWNSVVSPSDCSLKKRNNTELSSSGVDSELMKTPDSCIEESFPKEQSTPNLMEQQVVQDSSISKTPKPMQRSGVRKPLKDRAKYYPNMPELLSETFLRRSAKSDTEFESTLWKREKELCERLSPRSSEHITNETNGVIRPLRTSVKETVHKFESFSKKDKNARVSSLRSLSGKSLSKSVSSGVSNNVGRSLSDILKESCNKSLPAIHRDINVSTAEGTVFEEQSPISEIEVKLKNDVNQGKTSQVQSTNEPESEPTETVERKISHLTIPCLRVSSDNQQNVSLNTTTSRKSKPTLFSINIRKLNRRASDIGCIRKLAKKENSLRHSICGTDLMRSVAKSNLKGKATANIDNIHLQKTNKSVTSLAEGDIQHCKLTCWKCGSKVFKLDEIAFNEKAIRAKRFLRRFSTSPVPTNSSDTTQRIFPSVEEMKSIEDLYIDDDFECGQDTLGANMRLLSPEQDDDLFDILSIDFLSTDFFEPID